MSEQQQKTKSFMQELDEWCEGAVIDPLIDSEQEINDGETLEDTIARVKKAIRAKVLESYRNGQQAVGAEMRKPAPSPDAISFRLLKRDESYSYVFIYSRFLGIWEMPACA
jgi:hypothetical protein